MSSVDLSQDVLVIPVFEELRYLSGLGYGQ